MERRYLTQWTTHFKRSGLVRITTRQMTAKPEPASEKELARPIDQLPPPLLAYGPSARTYTIFCFGGLALVVAVVYNGYTMNVYTEESEEMQEIVHMICQHRSVQEKVGVPFKVGLISRLFPDTTKLGEKYPHRRFRIHGPYGSAQVKIQYIALEKWRHVHVDYADGTRTTFSRGRNRQRDIKKIQGAFIGDKAPHFPGFQPDASDMVAHQERIDAERKGSDAALDRSRTPALADQPLPNPRLLQSNNRNEEDANPFPNPFLEPREAPPNPREDRLKKKDIIAVRRSLTPVINRPKFFFGRFSDTTDGPLLFGVLITILISSVLYISTRVRRWKLDAVSKYFRQSILKSTKLHTVLGGDVFVSRSDQVTGSWAWSKKIALSYNIKGLKHEAILCTRAERNADAKWHFVDTFLQVPGHKRIDFYVHPFDETEH